MDIPVDLDCVQDIAILVEQHLDDPEQVNEVLRIIVSAELEAGNVVDLRNLLKALLPSIDHGYLGLGALQRAKQRFVDRWVRGPLVLGHLAEFCGLQLDQVDALLLFADASMTHLVDQICNAQFLLEDAAQLLLVKQALHVLHRQAVLVTAADMDAAI